MLRQDLENEKRRFSEFECDMKKRCEDLQQELAALRSSPSPSSSSVAIQTVSAEDAADTSDDEDYDIDDVIRELNSIVVNAECDLEMKGSTTSTSVASSTCSTEEDVLIPTLPRLRTARWSAMNNPTLKLEA